MSKRLKFVAQEAMDLFYADFKSDIEFFDLDDFILYCGNSVEEIYSAWFKEQYALIRQEKKDEIVSFDPTWCDSQILDVSEIEGRLFATYKQPIMAFPYESQSSGLQNVFPVEMGAAYEFERSSLDAVWHLKYLPTTNRIFFYSDINGVGFVNKGKCNVRKARVLYIPSPHGLMNVPDGIVDMVKTKAVATIKELDKNNVVKKSLDQNLNRIIQSELNTESLKQ